jgi:hypothetical protein
MNDREERIRFLARRNAGRKLIGTRRRAVASILGMPEGRIVFCSLEESDVYRQRFFEEFAREREAAAKTSATSGSQFQLTLTEAAKRLRHPERPCLILFSDSDLVGAIRASEADLWAHAIDLLNLDGDTIAALSDPDGNGLILDRDVQGTEQVSYQANAWGAEWKTALTLAPQR